MIHGTPQIMPPAADLYEHLSKVPAPMMEATHPAQPLAPNVCRQQWAEAILPQQHRFVADVDPALDVQVLDVAQAERKTNVHHHLQPDHLR